MEKGAYTNWLEHREGLRLVLPSDGELHQPCLTFLEECGLAVERHGSRRYTAHIPSIEGTAVLFQRNTDITQKVEEGSADLGIVGLDRFLECRREGRPVISLIDDLGFGRCDLVVAVPDPWLDVTSMSDLADLAVEFRQEGRQLRIATKYPRLAQKFLFSHGIYYFSMVQASGTLEAAPAAGYADLIVDLMASGTTLRENRLKILTDGTILASQACLIGHRVALLQAPEPLGLARALLENIEAHIKAGAFYRLTANVQGASPEVVSASILTRPNLAGLQGPTLARVYNLEEDWYSVSLLVPRESLLEAVDHLRQVGGRDISASPVSYLFDGQCAAYQHLLESGRGD